MLKYKSETKQTFKIFHLMVQNQFNSKIQVFHTNNGGEYFNTILGKYLLQNGIIHQSYCSHSPQQNGISERKNHHLLEVARSIMFTANEPKTFWGDAILTACYLINHMPSRVLEFQAPLKNFQSCFPHTRTFTSLPLKIFGCTSFIPHS